MKIAIFTLARILAILPVPACLHAQEVTLYQRLGGEPVLMRVAQQTLDRVGHDPAVNQSFEGINLAKLSGKLYVYLCSRTGGSCDYNGDDLKTVHAGHNITEREMNAMVESLRAALDGNGVGEREKNELLRLLAPHKRDIVTR